MVIVVASIAGMLIGATVLGGSALSGGRGRVSGSIIGACRGIGEGIAERFAHDSANLAAF